MANLYVDESLTAAQVGDLIAVTGDEGRHAVRVSRLRLGEQTIVANGAGLRAHGTVDHVGKDNFVVRVERVETVPAPARRIVLVQALAKGDRDERAVEQATEFGVDAIVPWQAERSVSRWSGEKAEKGVAKWSRIAREASKQSMRAWLPRVHAPMTTAELAALDGHVLVLHPRGEQKLSAWLPSDGRETPGSERETPGTGATGTGATGTGATDTGSSGTGLTGAASDVYLVVGPEGGLTDSELAALTSGSAPGSAGERRIVLLGDDVLRTSSAGPAALAVLNATLGRW